MSAGFFKLAFGRYRLLPVRRQSDTLTISYDSLDRPNQLKRGTTVLSDFDWNGDGTLAQRRDGDNGAIGWTTFSYDRLDRLAALSSPLYTSGGSPGFSWRMDGLLAGRTWPGTTNLAAVSYDTAKRPLAFTEQKSGVNQAVFTQAYDRAGNVTSEGRTLSGISGNAGTGTQTFTYDRLNRVTSGTLGGVTTGYTYDGDGNRETSTVSSVTTFYTYDRADQPAGQPVLALLEFVTVLSPEEAARLAQRAGTVAPISDRITGDVFFGPDMSRHPKYEAAASVSVRLRDLLAHKAPEEALNAYDLGHGRYRFDEPGWDRLKHAAASFAAVIIMPDAFAPAVIRAVRQRWERVVQP